MKKNKIDKFNDKIFEVSKTFNDLDEFTGR